MDKHLARWYDALAVDCSHAIAHGGQSGVRLAAEALRARSNEIERKINCLAIHLAERESEELTNDAEIAIESLVEKRILIQSILQSMAYVQH